MAPGGFQQVSLLKFCGYEGLDLSALQAVQRDMDCEAGPVPVQLSPQEAQAGRDKLQSAYVAGKQSCVVATGGSTVYAFLDAQGETKVSFEFYQGLLVRQDGMYTLAEEAR